MRNARILLRDNRFEMAAFPVVYLNAPICDGTIVSSGGNVWKVNPLVAERLNQEFRKTVMTMLSANQCAKNESATAKEEQPNPFIGSTSEAAESKLSRDSDGRILAHHVVETRNLEQFCADVAPLDPTVSRNGFSEIQAERPRQLHKVFSSIQVHMTELNLQREAAFLSQTLASLETVPIFPLSTWERGFIPHAQDLFQPRIALPWHRVLEAGVTRVVSKFAHRCAQDPPSLGVATGSQAQDMEMSVDGGSPNQDTESG